MNAQTRICKPATAKAAARIHVAGAPNVASAALVNSIARVTSAAHIASAAHICADAHVTAARVAHGAHAAAIGVRIVAGLRVHEPAGLELLRVALEARAAGMMPVMMISAGVMHVSVPLGAMMTMRPC